MASRTNCLRHLEIDLSTAGNQPVLAIKDHSSVRMSMARVDSKDVVTSTIARALEGEGSQLKDLQGNGDPPKKPAAMRNKKKNKNGPPQLPPHLRGIGPGAPPTGGSQPPASTRPE